MAISRNRRSSCPAPNRCPGSLGDVFGAMDHLLRRHRPHRAQLRIETDQAGNVGFIVLERIDVAFGGVFDEIPVKGLPPALFVKDPLDADLASVVQPSRNSARQAADSSSGEGGERRDDRDVPGATPNLLQIRQ